MRHVNNFQSAEYGVSFGVHTGSYTITLSGCHFGWKRHRLVVIFFFLHWTSDVIMWLGSVPREMVLGLGVHTALA